MYSLLVLAIYKHIHTSGGESLDLDSEVKMLRAVKKEHKMSVSVTYCGVHAVLSKLVNKN